MYKSFKDVKKFCAKHYCNNGSCDCPLSDGFDCLLGSCPINWDLRKVRNRLKSKVAQNSTAPNTTKATICPNCKDTGEFLLDGKRTLCGCRNSGGLPGKQ